MGKLQSYKAMIHGVIMTNQERELESIKILSDKASMLKSVIATITIKDSHLLKTVLNSYQDTIRQLTPLLHRNNFFKSLV